jgi:tmRNA-binding protein
LEWLEHRRHGDTRHQKAVVIDEAYFSVVHQPVYLHDMAVEPFQQRQGSDADSSKRPKLLPEHGQLTVFV